MLRELRRHHPEVTGAVLAGRDGLLISSDLPPTEAVHLAALAAVSVGVGHQVADRLRAGTFRESVVCTSAGCVVTYPAGRNALLALVVDAGADLPDLHGPARAVAGRAGAAVDAQPVGATPVPAVHAALGARTSLGVLARRRPGATTDRHHPPR
ncbi:roadblock/LC7 domain-containing protein [Micromonospora sp. KC723]|uniref:roadblock/LC7 domain-containing protein n=1 Tax=Micromonospora sp. KC723 TaxID=2530381 RepID=UPI00104B8668|nr:roadblock/LC7 domain-containing protein [Micromonospora sp. KC723]TDB76445.1 hypothetical protein E1165_07265 [Micromonospora sp. KC723]